MISNAQYWSAVSILALVAAIIPGWLMFKGEHVEALFIAIPSTVILICGIFATLGVLREE